MARHSLRAIYALLARVRAAMYTYRGSRTGGAGRGHEVTLFRTLFIDVHFKVGA